MLPADLLNCVVWEGPGWEVGIVGCGQIRASPEGGRTAMGPDAALYPGPASGLICGVHCPPLVTHGREVRLPFLLHLAMTL